MINDGSCSWANENAVFFSEILYWNIRFWLLVLITTNYLQ